MKWAIYIFVCFGLLTSAVQADSKRVFGVELDLNDKELDWNEAWEFAWPEHSYKLDPWREVAVELSELKPVASAQKFNGGLEIVDERLNRMIFKALGIKAIELSKPVYSIGKEKEIDAIIYNYKGAVPFEVRHTLWVWAIVIPNTSWDSAKKTMLAPLMERSKSGESLLKDSPDISSGEILAQLSSKLPPFLSDAIILENKGSLVIAGSKIKGHSSIPPGHYPLQNVGWLRRNIR